MITLSLCMIVKNEEDVLGRCLQSVKQAIDEIVIVDTGSTDSTKQIALDYGAKVYDFEWADNFSLARNYAFQLATSDYIMWLDADDIIKPNDLEKLLLLKSQLTTSVRQVAAKYDVAFDTNGNTTFSYYRERIFLRQANFLWKGVVHETINIESDCMYADFCVSHLKKKKTSSDRNLKIYEKYKDSGGTFTPRDLYYYARELYYNNKFDKAINKLTEFLNTDAWVEDKIGASLILSKCLMSTGKKQEALNALFGSFFYDLPRAEICCELGNIYFNADDYNKAIYWYQSAIRDNGQTNKLAFSHDDCYKFIPFMQLCVCYDRLGKHEIAELYNKQATLIKPDHPSVLKNIKYFSSLKNANNDF